MRSGVQRFPRDTETINALKEKDVYNIKSKNRTYLLERLENYQNNEPVVIEGNTDITIEHIFPQNPDSKWKVELGNEEYNYIKENYLNTIGNLTLSGNNGKLGNKYFTEKQVMNDENKEQGYKFSRLWLNRELKTLKKWGRKEIENRTNVITERFINIWQHPDIQLESMRENNEVNIFEAEDPNGKKIEYYVLLDQRRDVSSAKDFYVTVFQQLFELSSELFFTTGLRERIMLVSDINIERLERDYEKLNDTYYLYTNITNSTKFERIKEALAIIGLEDELTIKFKS